MRVTELTKHNAVRTNMYNNANELQDLTVNMSTGRKVNRPADDPTGVSLGQGFRTSIDHSKTLERNLAADKMWLTASEDTLQQMNSAVQHIKELALEGGNATSTREFRQSAAVELKTIARDLIELANKKEGKLYIFSGTQTFTPPLKNNEEIVKAELFLDKDILKSEKQIIPLLHDEPIEDLESGSFYLTLYDQKEIQELENEEDKTFIPIRIRVDVEAGDSLNTVVEKINEAVIKDGSFIPDSNSPLGYRTLVQAVIDNKNHLSLEPAHGITLQLERIVEEEEYQDSFLATLLYDEEQEKRIPNDFLEVMGLKVIDPIRPENDISSQRFLADQDEYDANWVGYSNNEYLVRIIKAGGFGEAQYVVSDNNGVDWSLPKILQRKIEVFNPEGKASDHLKLQFETNSEPYFEEGMDLFFKGNPSVIYQGNDEPKEILIDNGIKVALNLTARDLFFANPHDPETVNLFDVVHRLIVALDLDDPRSVLKSVGDIDIAMNQLLKGRAHMGSLMKELEEAKERIAKEMDYRRDAISDIEDMDMAEAAMDLNTAEMKNKVSLDTAARLIQPTLVNFLK